MNSPIDTLIIPQGLLIHEKKQSSKISCYCPFKELRGLEEELDQERRREQELFANMTKPFQVGRRLRPDDVFAILNFGKYEML